MLAAVGSPCLRRHRISVARAATASPCRAATASLSPAPPPPLPVGAAAASPCSFRRPRSRPPSVERACRAERTCRAYQAGPTRKVNSVPCRGPTPQPVGWHGTARADTKLNGPGFNRPALVLSPRVSRTPRAMGEIPAAAAASSPAGKRRRGGEDWLMRAAEIVMALDAVVEMWSGRMEEVKEALAQPISTPQTVVSSGISEFQGLHGASKFGVGVPRHQPATSPLSSASLVTFKPPGSSPVKQVTNSAVALPNTGLANLKSEKDDNGPDNFSCSGASIVHLTKSTPDTSASSNVYAVQSSNQVVKSQDINPVVIQAFTGNPTTGIRATPGVGYGPPKNPFVHNNDIKKSVQQFLHQPMNHPSWTPPSTEYMYSRLCCQICKVVISDADSLLVCDACERGAHLICLQNYGNKGVPKAEWHCSVCLTQSKGKPLPPKYGKVTRAAVASKAAPPCSSRDEEMVDGVAVDGSTSCIPGQADLEVEEDEDDDAEHNVSNDFISLSSGSLKRASSTSTTGTSPAKKRKSPMVKIFRNLLALNTKVAEQKLSFMERHAVAAAEEKRKMKEQQVSNLASVKKLALEAGVERGSAEHLAIGYLCNDSVMRELFLDCQTPAERLQFIRRYTKHKQLD